MIIDIEKEIEKLGQQYQLHLTKVKACECILAYLGQKLKEHQATLKKAEEIKVKKKIEKGGE